MSKRKVKALALEVQRLADDNANIRKRLPPCEHPAATFEYKVAMDVEGGLAVYGEMWSWRCPDCGANNAQNYRPVRGKVPWPERLLERAVR